jgi:large subunit ribosomal protein L13
MIPISPGRNVKEITVTYLSARRDIAMKTTFMANAANVERKWYVIDAEGKTVGRLAAEVAKVLRGKNKPTFTPHVDTGDHVIVINAAKAVFTGKKLIQKTYFRHSGYVGGTTFTTAGKMMSDRPERVIELAVKGMLPKNTLGRQMYRKLNVYAGADHPHAAQQPEVMEINVR